MTKCPGSLKWLVSLLEKYTMYHRGGRSSS
jgi:hypothetical protein